MYKGLHRVSEECTKDHTILIVFLNSDIILIILIERSRYVIVVEHDLAVLDYMSDQICCLYGQPGVYGVVTQRLGVGNGVNQFLAGYFPSENMRFRPFSLDFRLTVDVGDADGRCVRI
eukprot:COSAG05_NODE_650_length_8102_cov_16.263383_4_plen_118_part_00